MGKEHETVREKIRRKKRDITYNFNELKDKVIDKGIDAAFYGAMGSMVVGMGTAAIVARPLIYTLIGAVGGQAIDIVPYFENAVPQGLSYMSTLIGNTDYNTTLQMLTGNTDKIGAALGFASSLLSMRGVSISIGNSNKKDESDEEEQTGQNNYITKSDDEDDSEDGESEAGVCSKR